LRTLFEHSMPELVTALARVEKRVASGLASADELAEFYQSLPTLDFSRELLQPNPQRLRVLRVPVCGWSDLGTPRRVADVLRSQHVRQLKGIPPTQHMPGVLNLAAQQARLQPH
jgi:mannose-1-phosphate guanylyltransferase